MKRMVTFLVFVVGWVAAATAAAQVPPEAPPWGGQVSNTRGPKEASQGNEYRYRISFGLDGLTTSCDIRVGRKWAVNVSGFFFPLVFGSPGTLENWFSYQSFGLGVDYYFRKALVGLSVGGRAWIGAVTAWDSPGEAIVWWGDLRAIVGYTWDLNGVAITLEGGLQMVFPEAEDDTVVFLVIPHVSFRVGWFG